MELTLFAVFMFCAHRASSVAGNADLSLKDVIRTAEKEWRFASKLESIWGAETNYLHQCASEETKLDCGPDHTLVIIAAELLKSIQGSPKEITGCAKKLNVSKSIDNEFEASTTAASFVPPVNIWRQIVTKCSGESKCEWQYSYSHVEDSPFLRVTYYCAPGELVVKECGGNLAVDPSDRTEGFIKTPGYPNFYSRVEDCSWNITTQQPYSLLVVPLDINVKEANMKTGQCEDFAEINSESGDVSYKLCGKSHSVRFLLANSTRVNVHFNTGGWDTAKGAFFYYKVIGCPNVTDVENATVVYQSPRIAVLVCEEDPEVPSSHPRWIVSHCLPSGRWDNTLVTSCKAPEGELPVIGDNFVLDYLVPTLLMATMFIVAGVVWRRLMLAVERESRFEVSSAAHAGGKPVGDHSVDGPSNRTLSASLSPCSLDPGALT